jgi:hypothetical protein
VPHFQVVKTDGTALGTRELRWPDWLPGSVIYTAPDVPNLRVLRNLETGHDDLEMNFVVLVVEDD